MKEKRAEYNSKIKKLGIISKFIFKRARQSKQTSEAKFVCIGERTQKMYQRVLSSKGFGFIIIIGLISIAVFSAIFLINLHINAKSRDYVFSDINSVPETQVALILGAKVIPGIGMSPMLKDRVITALELYEKGKVQRFLVSGDHGTKDYDEVNIIKEYLLEQGVPSEDIFLDHAGFDTYDSLFRAEYIFKVESLTAITQNFHLSRAVYLGRSLGINAYGFSADRQLYAGIRYNESREKIAKVKAFFDIFFHSKPRYLGEPIPITGDSKESWDWF